MKIKKLIIKMHKKLQLATNQQQNETLINKENNKSMLPMHLQLLELKIKLY